jgi:hypothetical protein
VVSVDDGQRHAAILRLARTWQHHGVMDHASPSRSHFGTRRYHLDCRWLWDCVSFVSPNNLPSHTASSAAVSALLHHQLLLLILSATQQASAVANAQSGLCPRLVSSRHGCAASLLLSLYKHSVNSLYFLPQGVDAVQPLSLQMLCSGTEQLLRHVAVELSHPFYPMRHALPTMLPHL